MNYLDCVDPGPPSFANFLEMRILELHSLSLVYGTKALEWGSEMFSQALQVILMNMDV